MGDVFYMKRCLELAQQGAGFVSPNPMVGAVLVHNNLVIGEGYHQQYGKEHAEVNCINQAIKNGHADKLNQSALYVSLEPCTHFGKTPPCADFIIQKKIPKVGIGCLDPFPEVNGKGVERLKQAGIEVIPVTDEMRKECIALNKRFFTFHARCRPYIILKWAQTADRKIAPHLTDLQKGRTRLLISNEYTNRLVHKWRSEEAAILVGTNTALQDDPELTSRLWPGNSPIRLVLDMNLRLPAHLKLFDGNVKSIVFNAVKQEENGNLIYKKINEEKNIIYEIVNALFQLNIQSVLVEGGAKLLQTFIDAGLWDEARIITNEKLIINNGLDAPKLTEAIKINEEKMLSDKIEIYTKANPG